MAAPLSKVDVVNPADIAEGAPILQTGSGRSYTLRALEEGETAEGGVMLAVQDGKGGYRIGMFWLVGWLGFMDWTDG